MIKIKRDYFSALEKHVDSSDYLTTQRFARPSVITILQFSFNYHGKIKKLLNQQGFVILDLSPILQVNLDDLGLWLSNFLGDLMTKKNPHRKNYCPVIAESNSKYFVNSSFSQPLHTDEGYSKTYPKYLALYCKHQANNGGVSTLFDFFSLYPLLCQYFSKTLKQLNTMDAVTLHGITGFEAKPILLSTSLNDPAISYCATLKQMSCSLEVFKIFNFITRYIHQPLSQIRFKLQSNQVLLLDNTRILHGRTKFDINDRRELYRYWFNENCINNKENLNEIEK